MKQIFVHFEQIGKQVLGDIDNKLVILILS